MENNTIVMKFGGTSIGNYDMILNMCKIVENKLKNNKNMKIILIFSAFSKITDSLLNINKMAYNNKNYEIELKELILKIDNINDKLIKNIKNYHLYNFDEYYKLYNEKKNNLINVLKGVYLVKENYLKTLDYILSFGEFFSSNIIYHYMKKNYGNYKIRYVNSSYFIKTNNNYGNAIVNLEKSKNLLKNEIEKENFDIIIAPGFVASDENNKITTIGRNGSDYTASIFAYAINAKYIEIWSDVDGVLDANPNIVKDAKLIKELNYEQALEVTYYGCKVLYYKTIQPLIFNNINLYIKNTNNINSIGTKISKNDNTKDINIFKCITHINDIILCKFKGSFRGKIGMINRLSNALKKFNINIILISQCSSEISINFCIKYSDYNKLIKCLESEFSFELDNKYYTYKIKKNISIMAIIASSKKYKNIIINKISNIIEKENILIDMINIQDISICIVMDSKNIEKYIQKFHNLLTKNKLNLYLIGYGNVGKELVNLIKINNNLNKHINICMISNSKKYIINNKGLDITNNLLEYNGKENKSIELIIEDLDNINNNKVVVDCTSNNNICNYYDKIIKMGFKIITPNKKGMSNNFSLFKKLYKYNLQKKYFFETTVCAGLPIISRIIKLQKSGHKIEKIEGILSGTINYVLTEYIKNKNKKFKDIVYDAWKNKYTEPNPYDDLNGLDIARKILIISRLCNSKLSLDNIDIFNLVIDNKKYIKHIDILFDILENKEKDYNMMREKCINDNCKIKYIAEYNIKNNKCKCNIKYVKKDNIFYNINGTDNIVIIYTDIYKNGIKIIGPGAGIKETASGIIEEINNLII